jgi:hypothetical protein
VSCLCSVFAVDKELHFTRYRTMRSAARWGASTRRAGGLHSPGRHTLKQASETTIQLKACDYKWSVTRSGVNFSPGTKVKISGAGKGLTRIVSPLGGELSAGSDPTSSARCKAIWLQGYGDERDAESNGEKNTMENLGHANGEGGLFETNLGCPTGHNDESCPVLTSVTRCKISLSQASCPNA